MFGIRHSAWRCGLLRAGPLGRRIELRTTGGPDAATAARLIDRPSRPIARVAALFDRAAARLSIGPRTANPLAGLEPILDDLLIDVDGAAVIRSSMPGRLLAAVSSDGSPRYVLKVGQAADRPLRNEAEFLQVIPGMGLPIRVPELFFAGLVGKYYIVVTIAWLHSRPAGPLTRKELLDITEVLGTSGTGGTPLVHGDLAPWNVLRTPEGLGLVDWEAATFADQPMRDLIHYLMQTGTLLRWADARTVVRELTHPEGVVAELASRLNRPPSLAREALREYFALSPPTRSSRIRRFRNDVAAAVDLVAPH